MLTQSISVNALRFVAFLLLVLFAVHAAAVDPDKRITQYAHIAWRTRDGFFSGSPRAITQTTDGYIWIATQSELFQFDGVRLMKCTPSGGGQFPSSKINALSKVVQWDGSSVRVFAPPALKGNQADGLRGMVAARDGSVWLGFNIKRPGIGLQKVVGDRLEGRDNTWQDAGSRRQAFYTDLPPGHYRFRVIASNNDGLWNEQGAMLAFSVAPAWYQTIWFLTVCIIVGMLGLWAIHRLRVAAISKAMNARFNERLAERTRIARDLHDTLLQTIQGSKLVADDALETSSDPARMRKALEQLSTWLQQAGQEGRAALNSLRVSAATTDDLAEALKRVLETAPIDSLAATITVSGDVRDIHPIVRDEVYRVGYEAIRNAHAHSGNHVEVQLRYADDLTLRITYDGTGADASTFSAGKEGHYGVRGMRERARRIGARLSIVSDAARGTEVCLIVPGGIAFRGASDGKVGGGHGSSVC